jgi:hypothetical protein
MITPLNNTSNCKCMSSDPTIQVNQFNFELIYYKIMSDNIKLSLNNFEKYRRLVRMMQ